MRNKRKKRTPSERAPGFALPADWWERFKELVAKISPKLATFFSEKKGIISEKHLRRSKQSKRISRIILERLATAFGLENDWRTMLKKLGGKPPPLPAMRPIFGEAQGKGWQRLPRVECPHPHADGPGSPPPFRRELDDDIYYAKGWIVHLRANAHY